MNATCMYRYGGRIFRRKIWIRSTIWIEWAFYRFKWNIEHRNWPNYLRIQSHSSKLKILKRFETLTQHYLRDFKDSVRFLRAITTKELIFNFKYYFLSFSLLIKKRKNFLRVKDNKANRFCNFLVYGRYNKIICVMVFRFLRVKDNKANRFCNLLVHIWKI